MQPLTTNATKERKMAIETVNQPKGAARLVTAPHSFHPCGWKEPLFEVKAGVSAKDALEAASCLLDVAGEVATGIGMGMHAEDSSPHHSTHGLHRT
jgi:hypothetical protein